jgi:hypothetical protein
MDHKSGAESTSNTYLESFLLMKFYTICVSLLLGIWGTNGFTAATSKSFLSVSFASRRPAPVAKAYRQYGPAEEAAALESFVHPGVCPCCVTSGDGLTPRAARIEIPLRALFASAVFAGPALAEEAAAPAEASNKAPEAESDKPGKSPEVKPTEAQSKSEKQKPHEESKPNPVPKTFQEALEKFFPKALPTSVIATKVQSTLSERKFTRTNTLFGTCVCPDEINNKPTKSLPAAIQSALTDLNGVFHLGGLAGLPYMGSSGMKAFLSHCPTNGKVFIMYGPHIGITEDGTAGSVERLGLTTPSLDCDITLKALSIAQSALENKPKDNVPDKREEYIVANFRNALDSEQAAKLSKEALPAFATYLMFHLVKEQIVKQLQACLKDDTMESNNIDEIVLLGGITVNRGQLLGSIEVREDYFEPLVFESFTESQDLYLPAFGAKPMPFYAT